jgi:hypothetical protein
VNDSDVGEKPIILPGKSRQAYCTLELVRQSTAPVWEVSLQFTSNPPLLFWKQGKQKTLTEVPTKNFKYDHQFVFLPFSTGDSLKVPLEISSVKPGSYMWDVVIKSKREVVEKKIPVQFQ